MTQTKPIKGRAFPNRQQQAMIQQIHEEHVTPAIEKVLAKYTWVDRANFPKFSYQIMSKGRCAGQCRSMGHHRGHEVIISLLDQLFTPEHKNELIDTITHEWAHAMVIWLMLRQDSPYYRQPWQKIASHGPEFRQMHRMFGGNGERCCKAPGIKPVKARRTRYFIYNVEGYGEVKVPSLTHKKIQNDGVTMFRQHRFSIGGKPILSYHWTGAEILK